MEHLNTNRKPTLHILGLFHTVPSEEYSHCAFTGKVLRFSEMMNMYGYTTIEYANEGSESAASYKVPILSEEEFKNLKGETAKTDFVGNHAVSGTPLHKEFEARLIYELKKRVKPRDIILHPFGYAHSVLLGIFDQTLHIESGIGYDPYCTIKTPYKVFESNAHMHAYYGNFNRFASPSNYWFVVPNYFNLKDWDVETTPGDYIAFLGRINSMKGTQILYELASYVDKKIVLCGQGDPKEVIHPNIEYKGPLVGRERSDFLKNAYCTLTPSMFLEPFCGVSIESMLCGTPVLSSNYGAFTENIINGFNGFRNNTLQDWVDSYEKIKDLDRQAIADHTRSKFSLEAVGKQYDNVFKKVYDLYDDGWYTVNKKKIITS